MNSLSHLLIGLAATTLACTASPGAEDGDSPGDGGDCRETKVHGGDATWYELGGNPVNCGFPTDSLPPHYAALNGPQYGDAAYCGACILAEGPNGSVELLIVDQCPECAFGDIDLSPAAFEQIAALDDGRVEVTWRVVPCSNPPATIGYRFKQGSSQWWTAVQVVGHRTPLASLAYRHEGAWVDVPRLDYNYFVAEQGMGPGPLELRVTDVFGEALYDSDIELIADESVLPGDSQFSECQ